MRVLSRRWGWVLVLLWVSGLTHAQTDARAVMEKLDAQQRQVLDLTLTRSTLSSCQFGQQGKTVACVETPRVKELESISRQTGQSKKDSQSISIVLEPANERGIGMLTYSYDDPKKDTESWLYLSALGKVKRMVAGGSEDREPVALFGSEFTTEDMETGKTEEYTYQILQEGPYQGRQVWVIEALPKPERLRKTRYSKLLVWVDKERFVALKMQSYDKRGGLYKRMSFDQFEQNNGLWLAREVTVFNLKTQRLSTMRTSQIAMGVEVDPEFLTERALTDFAYREKTLSELRRFFQ